MTAGRTNGALPNLIVIGAMKCGTTSLHRYLDLHPEIGMSRPKELEFFIEERNWSRGIDWYRSHFRERFKVRGESSPGYSHHPRFPGVPARMSRVVPEARLILLVRDPIERMLSHYVHLVSSGLESRSVREALTAPLAENPYLRRSLYHTQLELYLERFPARRILVVCTEDLLERRRETLRGVFEFLEVDPGFESVRFRIRRHSSRRMRRKTGLGERLERTGIVRLLRRVPLRFRWPIEEMIFYPVSRRIPRPRLAPDVRSELADRLKSDVEKLEAFTGRRFAGWRV